MNQKDAIYTATRSVLTDAGVRFEDGDNIADVMTSDLRKSITEIVVQSFQSNEIDLKDTPENQAKLADVKELRSYVSGLVSNWFRKDKRFNGNTNYVPTNPGSRAGQGDELLKTYRALKKQYTATGETDKITECNAAITNRIKEISAEKNKKEINMDILPDDLKEKLGLVTD